MTQPSAVELWGAIKAWYAEHLPEVLNSLNPGASEEAWQAFEDDLAGVTGQNLPRGLQDIYLQNDGQDRTAVCGMFFGLEFLSLENVLEQWRGWREFALDDAWADLGENSTSYPPNAVRPVYAHIGWVPFAHDGSGNHIGIDMAPGPAGRVGQVINFGRDENNKTVMAASFEGFLEWQVRQLQSGNFLIKSEGYDGQLERHVVLRKPPNTHLLDAVPKLFGPKRQGFLWRPFGRS